MLPENLRQQFRDTLMSGQFNLLLGAGASLDAKNHDGHSLLGSGDLRNALCAEKGLNPNSTLSRAFGYLTPKEKQRLITQPFSGCKAGPTAHEIRSLRAAMKTSQRSRS